MHLVYRNVNEAFKTVVRAIYEGTFPVSVEGSRNGDVLRLEEPLLLTYTRPCERVLFNSRRDANPFMHVYEALWMLAGRNDLAPVAYYAKQMGEYSDDGVTLNGAYGYRWRHAKHGTGVRGNTSYGGTIKDHRDEIDQLDLVVKHLCDNPHSRRAVIQMWNVEDDLLRIDKGGDYPCCERVRRVERAPGDATTLTGGSCPLHGTTTFRSPSRDVCCNLSVIVQCREQDTSPNTPNRKDGVPLRFLDLYVTNRSNDLIWGLLGANAVHFSFLQEYLAARLGWEVGRMHTFTANAHAYQWNWKPEEWLSYYGSDQEVEYVNECCMVPLVEDAARFDDELHSFAILHGGRGVVNREGEGERFKEPFFHDVAHPMLMAFHAHKARDYAEARCWMALVEADDWRVAGSEWIERRRAKHERQR